jgi:hypothetical protein
MPDSITPPPELIGRWEEDWHHSKVKHIELEDHIANEAAQWGADQELTECLRYASDNGLSATRMRETRRPKPPSLKEQALLQLDTLNADLTMHGRGCDLSQIRRALEALPND